MQCKEIRAAFPVESEQPQYGATQHLFFLSMCAVFSSFHSTGCKVYSCRTDGYGIFNMRINVDACRTHEAGSSPNKPEQELTGGGRIVFVHPAPPGDRTLVLGFEF